LNDFVIKKFHFLMGFYRPESVAALSGFYFAIFW